MKVSWILCVLFSSNLSNAGTLGFYGFSIGESREDSIKNIKSRELKFSDNLEVASNTAGKRTFFESMKNQDRCDEETHESFNIITCSISSGEARSVVLYHLANKLVRIVANFPEGKNANLDKKLKERFGPSISLPKDAIEKIEAVTGKPNPDLALLLGNPFGSTTKCDGCGLFMFNQQKLSEDVVTLYTKDKKAVLTVYNSKEIEKALKSFQQIEDQKKNKANKNTDF